MARLFLTFSAALLSRVLSRILPGHETTEDQIILYHCADALAAQPVLRAETRGEAPDFKEVYDIIRAHLGGTSEEELNRKAVRGARKGACPDGFVNSQGEEGNAAHEGPAVSQTNLLTATLPICAWGGWMTGWPKPWPARATSSVRRTNCEAWCWICVIRRR